MQIDGLTADVLGMERLEAKWSAFGWETARVDGHDIEAMAEAVEAARRRATLAAPGSAAGGRPTMIVLDTIKGKGAAFCEGQVGSHNMNFDYETARKAVAELGR